MSTPVPTGGVTEAQFQQDMQELQNISRADSLTTTTTSEKLNSNNQLASSAHDINH
jgi:hypothetical protein